MKFNFVKFEKQRGRKSQVDMVKLTKGGILRFPSKFIEKNELTSANFVTLYFDAEKKTIGIRFQNIGVSKDLYRLGKSKSINCKKFLLFFDVTLKETKYYPYQIYHSEDNKYYTIQL